MNNIHVLFLSSWYPTEIQPTNGDFVMRHAQAVATQAQVGLIHVAYNSSINSSVKIVESNENGFHEIICYFKLSAFLKICKPLVFVCLYLRIFRKYKKQFGKPDVVHGNVIFPIILIANILKTIYSIPFVITEHWTGFLPYSGTKISNFKLKFIRRFSKKSSAIMPVSHDLQKAMKSYKIQGNYFVIQNVVDTLVFNPTTNTKSDLIKILHVSHLRDEHKNITGILRTIKELSLIRQDFVLQIVSEDSGQFTMQKVKEFGIESSVEFLGFKNRIELAECMQTASFLLLFSNYENFPCVIVEAFASGIPVLSSNVGGIAEHVTSDKGILVSAKNEVELLNALNKMCNTYSEYDSLRLQTYAQQNFSYDSVAKEIVRIYKNSIKS